jgi:hypothetical protein
VRRHQLKARQQPLEHRPLALQRDPHAVALLDLSHASRAARNAVAVRYFMSGLSQRGV